MERDEHGTYVPVLARNLGPAGYSRIARTSLQLDDMEVVEGGSFVDVGTCDPCSPREFVARSSSLRSLGCALSGSRPRPRGLLSSERIRGFLVFLSLASETSDRALCSW